MRWQPSLLIMALACVITGSSNAGEPCELGPGPAATLLLPYFEVDISNPDGVTTLVSINNATDQPTLTHLTFWTDYGIPTLSFNLFLTGFDVSTLNLRDIFVGGNIPITADEQSDPGDSISPHGFSPPSWDGSFENCEQYFPFFINPLIVGSFKQWLRESHTGQPSTLFT